jgi:hypothetical protein
LVYCSILQAASLFLVTACCLGPISGDDVLGGWQGKPDFIGEVPKELQGLHPQILVKADGTFTAKDFRLWVPVDGEMKEKLVEGEGRWHIDRPGKFQADSLSLDFVTVAGQPSKYQLGLTLDCRSGSLMLIDYWGDPDGIEGLFFRRAPEAGAATRQ